MMSQVYDKIRHVYQHDLERFPDAAGYLGLDVSYDGSYTKRGHMSLYAMGYVVEVYTGYIIDFEVLCKCFKCKRDKVHGIEECPHSKPSEKLYRGSSGSMEVQIAKHLWGRSRDHKFEYTMMVADGDCKSFAAVKDWYGLDSVSKEDCGNHVGKRMATRVENFGKTYCQETTFKSGARKGMVRKTYPYKKVLRDNARRFRNYYVTALRKCANAGVDAMRKEIMAAYHHHLATVFTPRHHHMCPPTADSWCKYSAALAEGKTEAEANRAYLIHHEKGVFSGFTVEAKRGLLKIFEDLTDTSLLEKCKNGYTQNINESLHQRLWFKCGKHKHHGRDRVEFMAKVTVLDHNVGYEQSCLLIKLGIASKALVKVLRFQDKEAARVARRRSRHREPAETEADAGPDYAAGMHD